MKEEYDKWIEQLENEYKITIDSVQSEKQKVYQLLISIVVFVTKVRVHALWCILVYSERAVCIVVIFWVCPCEYISDLAHWEFIVL